MQLHAEQVAVALGYDPPIGAHYCSALLDQNARRKLSCFSWELGAPEFFVANPALLYALTRS